MRAEAPRRRPRRRPDLRLAALVLVALSWAFALHGPHASLSILWRFAVVSFDSPATQALDELACQKTPCADPGRDAGESARAGLGAGRHVGVPDGSARRPALVVGAGITRSPPAA